jgi:Skp family chaperone for outer membrane proteins
MKTTKIALAVIIVLLLTIMGYMFLSKPQAGKIAYIELNKVFTEFEMKKELEGKIKHLEQKRNSILDSIKLELKILARQIESTGSKEKLAAYSVKEEQYFQKEKQFNDDNVATAKMYDDQIFNQINQYVKDYGTKNDYLAILGADGSGSLMYAHKGINITEEVKLYINERYKGKAN